MNLFTSGHCESFKGAYHGALAYGVLGAFGYNAAAFVKRREPHLALNAVIYLGLWFFERRKVRHHRSA